jgi:hypothetical protein
MRVVLDTNIPLFRDYALGTVVILYRIMPYGVGFQPQAVGKAVCD